MDAEVEAREIRAKSYQAFMSTEAYRAMGTDDIDLSHKGLF